MSENQPAKTITVRWLSERGIQSGCPFHLLAFHLMSRNRFLNLSKFRYPYAASIMVWATSFPASIFALLSTTPNSFFASPLAFFWSPMPLGRAHRLIRWVLRRDRKTRVSSQRKAKRVGIHMVSFRGGSSANQAWQRRPFPLTETAKSYNNRGGWGKSSTTIEVIEPQNLPFIGRWGYAPFCFRFQLYTVCRQLK